MFVSSGYSGYDFGWNPFKAVKKVVKRVGKVTRTTVKAISKGDIKGAVKGASSLINPVALTTKALSDDPRKLDWAKATMPTSVIGIENRDLRKKVALGYVAAAIVAGGIAAATGTSLTSGTAAAGGGAGAAGATGAGATGAGTAAAGTVGAGTLAKVATSAAGLLSKGGDGDSSDAQEQSGAESGGELYETERRDPFYKTTPGIAAIALGGVTAVGAIIYLIKRK